MRKFKSKSLILSNSPKGGRTAKRSYRLLAGLIAVAVVALCATSCKAWRTVSTTATYVQTNDSAKVTQTITTKTVESYEGVKH